MEETITLYTCEAGINTAFDYQPSSPVKTITAWIKEHTQDEDRGIKVAKELVEEIEPGIFKVFIEGIQNILAKS